MMVALVIALALVLFVLQTFSFLLPGGIPGTGSSRVPTSVARIVLEPAPEAVAVGIVLVDESGRDAVMSGQIVIEIREQGGAVVQLTRSVGPGDFRAVPPGSQLVGRLGYRKEVPLSSWPRRPRPGAPAFVTVTVIPDGGQSFTDIGTGTFP